MTEEVSMDVMNIEEESIHEFGASFHIKKDDKISKYEVECLEINGESCIGKVIEEIKNSKKDVDGQYCLLNNKRTILLPKGN
ncbi:MAG: hypothetical protein IJ797_01395, partial [Selenomonadaceae bacterium]|nr:hypothetical protein [Selenomonadaceae bacterium]